MPGQSILKKRTLGNIPDISGGIQFAHSEDVSSTATALTTTFAAITPTIEVVAFPKPNIFYWLSWACGLQTTSAATGAVFIGPGEINIANGTYAVLDTAGSSGAFTTGIWSKYGGAKGMCPIGIVTTARIFRLGGQIGADSGTLGISVRSRSAGVTSPRTFLTLWGYKVS